MAGSLSLPQMTDKQWDTILALHNTAPFKLVRAAAPFFRVKDGEPRNIINISSTSGINGNAYGHGSSATTCSNAENHLEVKPIMVLLKLA